VDFQLVLIELFC